MPQPLSESLHDFPGRAPAADPAFADDPFADDPFADDPYADAPYADAQPAPAAARASARPATVRALHLADRDATLRRATGSDDGRVQGWLVNDVAFALNMPPSLDAQGREDRVCAAVSAMCEIGPRDAVEGMLAAQMVAVHSASLECLRRAADPLAADRARDADLHHAGRLLHVFQRQLRVRDDRRNPFLAHSLSGRLAPDAPGRLPGARVAPARDRQTNVAPAGDPRTNAAPARDAETGPAR